MSPRHKAMDDSVARHPRPTTPASPGAEMGLLDLRELVENLRCDVMRRFDKQEALLRRDFHRPWALQPPQTASPAAATPATPRSRPEEERPKPRPSSPDESSATKAQAAQLRRPSFRPIFHTFTQADLALKQRAADVDSNRMRRVFQAHGSSVGVKEQRPSRLRSLVNHAAFDSFFAILVVSQTIFIGVEVQETLSNPGVRPASFIVVQNVYTSLFTLELCLRIAVEGCRFFCAEDWAWGWLDLVVVTSGIAEVIFDVVASQGVTNMTGLRAFRVIRITRFLKTLRLIRVFRFVMALRTLITSILYTLRSLFWALVLLALIIYVFSLLLAQAVSDHLLDAWSQGLSGDYLDAAARYFGSLPQTMLSLFMTISGGVSWKEVLAPLENMSLVWVFVFLFYVAFTYFAVLNVLTGVFCQSAIESAQNDHANVVQSMLANKEAHVEKIRALFSKLGAEKDGMITYSMFEDGVNSQAVIEYFETLGLDVWDAWSFFKLLDLDSGGAVEIEEFFKGCLRLRGQARGVDVGKLLHDQSWLIKNQGHFQTYMETKMRQILDMLTVTTGIYLEDPTDAGWTRGITPFKDG